ncbi:hypothetical protein, partial [Anaplasma bovis]|uniref:hypothetical protein n=1 Tax=Anaplasma bovis TaxID=186733 RepID=UPI002FF098AB
DSPSHEELDDEIEEQEDRPIPSRVSHPVSYGTTPQERSTRSPHRKQRVEEIELTDLSPPRQPVRRYTREAHTPEELEPLQRGLTLGDFKSRRAANREQQEGAFSSIKSKMFESAETFMQKVRPPISSEQRDTNSRGKIYLGAQNTDEELSDSGFYPQLQSEQCPRNGIIGSVPHYAQDSTSSGQRLDKKKEGAGRSATHSKPGHRNNTFTDSTTDIFLSPTGGSVMMGATYAPSLLSGKGAIAGKKPVKHVSFDKPYSYQSCNSSDSSDEEAQYQDYDNVGLEDNDSYEEECNVISTPHGDVRKRRSGQHRDSTRLTDVRVSSAASHGRAQEDRISPRQADISRLQRR